MKKKIYCLFLTFLPLIASAQMSNWSFFISGGGTASSMTGKGGDALSTYHYFSALILDVGTSAYGGRKLISSFKWSLGIKRKISTKFNLEIAFSNFTAGGLANISQLIYLSEFGNMPDTTYAGHGKDKFILKYWEIPLTLKYYPLQNRNFYFTAGGAYGYLRDAKEIANFTISDEEATYRNRFEYSKNMKSSYRHYNWVVILGTGYHVTITNYLDLAAELSYNRDINNIAKGTIKDFSRPIYNQSINAMIKLYYNF